MPYVEQSGWTRREPARRTPRPPTAAEFWSDPLVGAFGGHRWVKDTPARRVVLPGAAPSQKGGNMVGGSVS